MADIKWIKIVTDIFDDEKILLIESMPEADSIIVIWFKLLCLAGKTNNKGVFTLNDRVYYTDEMLSTIFRRPLNTIRLAIRTFQEYGMIEVINNVITIPNWGKHQTLDQIESRREYQRQYMAKKREEQKQIALCEPNSKSNSETNVSPIEEEGEEEKEIDKEEDIYIEKLSWKNLLTAYNDLPIKDIKTITDKRKSKVKARMNSLKITFDNVITAVNNIKLSSFLLGKNNRNWVVDFDWLFDNDNNFTKVYEGKYTDKEGNNGSFGQNNGKFAGIKPKEYVPKSTSYDDEELI